jgi:hypothetical protein
MSRRTISGSSVESSYKHELGEAMSAFLPHRGLPLLCADKRVRWTSRMLAVGAVLMAWSGAATLLDRFIQARAALVAMYPTRRRPGDTPEGFVKALEAHGQDVLATLSDYWRSCVCRVAERHWKVDGWLLFGVDGSKFDCSRTAANEAGFGVSGKGKSGPQQLLTCLFHVASGILWGWSSDGVQGRGEPTQLKQLLGLLPPDAMLLADAGYTGYELLRSILNRKNHFLIRVGSNVTLIKNLGYFKREGKQTVYLWPLNRQARNKRSMPRRLHKVCPPLTLRLIELADASGKPVYLLSSVLNARVLSNAAAAKIYRLRWGVEVMWRGLKQTLGHSKMLGKTPALASAELNWAMAGLWMLQLLAASDVTAAGNSPQNHSPAKALRVIRQTLGGTPRRTQSLRRQLGMATKDTYQRHGSKQPRYRRQQCPKRPPGAPKARTATPIEKQLIQRILEQPPPSSFAA